MPARHRLNHNESCREKIRTSQLLNRLQDHAFGRIDLNPCQIKSIEILLKKTLPDLVAVEGHLHVTHDAEQLSDAELLSIAAGGSPRAIAPPIIEVEPDQVH